MMITYPLHLIYKGITSFRNYLFDRGILEEYVPEVFTIGVGNLTVGGTGKTPMVNYLLGLLKDRHIGVISRGYGRKTKGFLPLTADSTPETAGDEPCMMARSNPGVRFFVSEDRVKGYGLALKTAPAINSFVFDDVFQHRYLQPHIRILLSDYHRPFYRDHVLPYGRLRESRKGAGRADIIVVTKCPEKLAEEEKETIRKSIRVYSRPEAPVFFAVYSPEPPVNEQHQVLPDGEEIILISALADNGLFYRQQATHYTVLKHFTFRDHYKISPKKLMEILDNYPGKPVITTEKDMIKIGPLLSKETRSLFYVPQITVKMDDSFANYLESMSKLHQKANGIRLK